MRTASLLLAALTLGALLAVAPPAAAGPACTTDLCPDPDRPPVCMEKTYGTYRDSVTVHADCSVDLVTGRGDLCVGAWYGVDHHQVGPVHWERHYCDFPGGDPLCCLDSASAAVDPIGPCTCPPPTLPCDRITQAIADRDDAVDFTLGPGCRVAIEVDMREIPGCEYGQSTEVSRGPVTVITSDCTTICTCDPQPVPLAAQAPDYCELKAATPEPLRARLWGADAGCDVDVEPIAGCAPPSSSTIERRIAFVHLRLLVCGGGIGDPGGVPDLIQP